MPLTLFASRPFFVTLLLYGALGGLLVLLPYRLFVGGGYTLTRRVSRCSLSRS
ncbi:MULTISPECIES: hypothetical protein [unclassified Sphingomonas]|uniref:hypothetical protein n=1 Tax=unclassified Sphingomonas TaxID=196159 RepID=UPI00217D8D7A|nr:MULTISPECIES: hypothetical protein [unclassified Sphingomonas]